MGIHTEAKKFLRALAPAAFYPMSKATDSRYVGSVLVDANSFLKTPTDHATGEDFVREVIFRHAGALFGKGAEMVMYVFDRHRPPNKEIRHGNVIPMKTPTCLRDVLNVVTPQSKQNIAEKVKGFYDKRNGESHEEAWNRAERDFVASDPCALFVVADDRLPSKANWKAFTCNRLLVSEFVHYLTCKIVNSPIEPNIVGGSGVDLKASNSLNSGYVTPLHKKLCLYGGLTTKPRRTFSLAELPKRDDFVWILESRPRSDISQHVLSESHLVRSVKRGTETLPDLGEGEVSCVFHMHALLGSSDCPVRIETVDGDLLLMLLLYVRNKPGASGPNASNLTLLLKTPAKGPENRLLVDVLALESRLRDHPRLGRCADPVASVVGMLAMMGNDYFGSEFCWGLRGGTDSMGTPWVMKPLLEKTEAYSDMISRRSGLRATHIHRPDTAAKTALTVTDDDLPALEKVIFRDAVESVRVNLDAFREYVKDCYLNKHACTKTAEDYVRKKMQGSAGTPVDERTFKIEYVSVKLTGKNKIMGAPEIYGDGRRLVWLLNAWNSAYHGNLPDCLERMRGVSVYGFEKADDGQLCRRTNEIATDFLPLGASVAQALSEKASSPETPSLLSLLLKDAKEDDAVEASNRIADAQKPSGMKEFLKTIRPPEHKSSKNKTAARKRKRRDNEDAEPKRVKIK